MRKLRILIFSLLFIFALNVTGIETLNNNYYSSFNILQVEAKTRSKSSSSGFKSGSFSSGSKSSSSSSSSTSKSSSSDFKSGSYSNTDNSSSSSSSTSKSSSSDFSSGSFSNTKKKDNTTSSSESTISSGGSTSSQSSLGSPSFRLPRVLPFSSRSGVDVMDVVTFMIVLLVVAYIINKSKKKK